MRQPFLLERTVLQIPHNGVQLRHGVAHGRSRCKHHAAPTCDLIQVAALAEHITRFLRFTCRQTSDIAHFCREEKVLVKMALIHKKPIHAQLLKGDNIILSRIGA